MEHIQDDLVVTLRIRLLHQEEVHLITQADIVLDQHQDLAAEVLVMEEEVDKLKKDR